MNEGIISMHPQVLNEVREKTPTPAFSHKVDGAHKGNIFMNMLIGGGGAGAHGGSATMGGVKKDKSKEGSNGINVA